MKRQRLLLAVVAAFGLATAGCTSDSTEEEAPVDVGSASPPVGQERTSSVIELRTPQSSDLIIPSGTMAVYDAAQGDLIVGGKLVIHGTLRFVSSKESVKDVAVQVSDITNDGYIQSELSGTVLLKDASGRDLTINSANGRIRTRGTIDVSAVGNISMQGGHFHAGTVRFSTPAKASIDAESIDGNVSIDAKKSRVGVADGDLKVIHQGGGEDPIYYSTNSSVTVPDLSAGVNGDVVAWAKKNVITSGIKASGTIKLYAGVSSYTWNVSPIPKSTEGCGAVPCSQAITFNYQNNAGTITVNGNLQSTQAGSIVAKTGWSTGTNPININGTITTAGGLVYLYAGGNVATGSINTSGPGSSGAVVIQAHRNYSQTNPFVIGGSGNSNGVNGTITAVNAGAQPLYSGFVYISNPAPTNSQGGITVTHATDINLSIGGSDNGSLILDNFYNPINLPSGTFSVDGQNGHPAGRLYIQGYDLTTGATTVTASEAGEPGSGQPHYVQIAANSITANGNLTLRAGGRSDFATSAAPNVGLWAFDSMFFDVVYNQLQGRIDIYPTLDTCFHYPIAINGSGTFTMQSRGSGTVVQTCNSYYSPGTMDAAISFNGGAATWDVNGRNGSDAGSILIDTDRIGLGPSTTLSLNADGDVSGKGGTIAVNAIGIAPTDLANLATVSANGGTTGDGGFVDIHSSSGNLTVNATTVTAAAGTGSGSHAGGHISLSSSGNLTVTGTLAADGTGIDGNGGTLILSGVGLNLDQVSSLSARGGPGAGVGGTITLTNSASSSTTLNGSINAKGGVVGRGGSVSFTTGGSLINNGSIDATTAGGTDITGSVTVQAAQSLTVSGAATVNAAGVTKFLSPQITNAGTINGHEIDFFNEATTTLTFANSGMIKTQARSTVARGPIAVGAEDPTLPHALNVSGNGVVSGNFVAIVSAGSETFNDNQTLETDDQPINLGAGVSGTFTVASGSSIHAISTQAAGATLNIGGQLLDNQGVISSSSIIHFSDPALIGNAGDLIADGAFFDAVGMGGAVDVTVHSVTGFADPALYVIGGSSAGSGWSLTLQTGNFHLGPVTAQRDISVESDQGVIDTPAPNQQITTTNGSIGLLALAGTISVQSTAFSAPLGNVQFAIDHLPSAGELTVGTAPANVTVNPPNGNVFWGDPAPGGSISASGTNTINVQPGGGSPTTAQRVVFFESGHGPSSISLNGNVTITAQP